jgi:hypothetical protein
MSLLDEIVAGKYRDRTEEQQESLRVLANSRFMTDSERACEVERILNHKPAEETTESASASGDAWVDSEDSTWHRVNLGPYLKGEVEILEPDVLRFDDGSRGLFYSGRVNGVHADSGLGKSMLIGYAAGQEMNNGENVLWIDLEDPNPSFLIERLRGFGVHVDTIAEHLDYRSPQEGFDDWAVDELAATATRDNVRLIVIDSLGEAFGLEGIDENADRDVGPWLRRVARRFADTGAAVVIIDHSTKSQDNPLHASGSKRKRAAITGASFLIDASRPLSREHGGQLRLTAAKDRNGFYQRGKVAAVVDFNVYPDGTTVHVSQASTPTPEEAAAAKLDKLVRAAVQVVKTDGTSPSKNAIVLAMGSGRTEDKRAAVDIAVSRGYLKAEPGRNNAMLHTWDHDPD